MTSLSEYIDMNTKYMNTKYMGRFRKQAAIYDARNGRPLGQSDVRHIAIDNPNAGGAANRDRSDDAREASDLLTKTRTTAG